MSKALRFVSYLLSLLLAVLFGLTSILLTNESYMQTLSNYGRSKQLLHLYDIPEEKQQQVLLDLAQTIDKHHGLIIRTDSIITENGSEGYKFGFYGDPQANTTTVQLTYSGTTIFNAENISALLQAEQGATLGLDQVKADQIAPLPKVWGGGKAVAVKLTDLVSSSGTVHGTYRIEGLNHDAYQNLVNQLASTIGVDTDKLLTPSRGSSGDRGLALFACLIAITATWTTLLFVSIINAYQNVSVLGVHVLLGWSRVAYVLKIFAPLLFVSLGGVLISCAINLSGLQGFAYNPETITAALLAGTPAIALTALAIAIASSSIFFISPVNAIRNRVSSKVLVTCLLGAYLTASTGIVTAASNIDELLVKVVNLHGVQQRWASHSDLHILYKEKIGDNATSFKGQDRKHSVEYYNWYAEIEGQDGVYLAHTLYTSDAVLKIWRENNVYQHVPNKSYWTLLASPNYLTKQDIQIDQHLTEQAYAGTRVYLIPDTLEQTDRKQLEAYLTEYSDPGIASPIKNAFTHDPKLLFHTYHPDTEVFLWNTNPTLPNTTKDPVILIATANNMIPIESESLWANGLESSYLKLDTQATQTYLHPDHLAKHNLDDNNPQFLPVSDFIAGMQQSHNTVIQIFGSFVLLAVLLELIIIYALVKIFTVSKREHIAVKRLMGYPLASIFLPPIILVTLTTIICTTIAAILNATSGVCFLLTFGIIQLLALLYQARKASTQSTVSLIKSA